MILRGFTTVLAQRDEKRPKENENKKTKPFCTFVVTLLSSSNLWRTPKLGRQKTIIIIIIISQRQSITQKGVHTHPLTAREREHWFLRHLSLSIAVNSGVNSANSLLCDTLALSQINMSRNLAGRLHVWITAIPWTRSWIAAIPWTRSFLKNREKSVKVRRWATHRAGESEPRPTSGTTSGPTSAPTRSPTKPPRQDPRGLISLFSSLQGLPRKLPRNVPRRRHGSAHESVVEVHLSCFHLFCSSARRGRREGDGTENVMTKRPSYVHWFCP